MPRDTDEKKTRKALRKLRKAAERAEAEGIELSEWEQEFVEGIDERLNKYGSAFNDPNLGASDEALSRAQTEILRQLDKKSRGKGGSSFKQRKPLKAKKSGKAVTPNVRDLNDDVEPPLAEPVAPKKPELSVIKAVDLGKKPESAPAKATGAKDGTKRTPPKVSPFRVIEGGKSESES